ncbi:reverse transcriptase domain-containing protein [Tanacetum coccineum]
MFNSTLTGNARVWFDKLPKESIDSSEDLRTVFRENYLQQTKHIKDPVEIHHIKQRDGESTEDFMERYKAEVLDVEGAPECMRISGFMHGITHPGLIKRLYERIPRSVDEMYRMTTSFLQGEVAALSHGRKKVSSSWKPSEGGDKPTFKKGFKNKQRPDQREDKSTEKGDASGKDKPLTILMIQPWERVAKPRITQSFSPEIAISFPPLSEEDGTEGPMIIEVEMGGHFVHRVYIDGGASSEVLYEHCFVKLRKEIRDQMVPATTHLVGFSGETIWPLGQIALLVKIGNEAHSTSAWMNFMVIRSSSQHNAIIGRPGIRKIRAVPSTAHGMLKFPVEGGTVTLQSSRIIPRECAMISGPSTQPTVASPVPEEKINIAIHPEYPEQTVAIGSTLTEKGRKELCALLKQNLDIFAWKPADMTGVPRNIAEHCLNIREGYSPVRQKKRGQAPERNKAIQEEVTKLVDAGIMKEVHYHSWLSNPVMVKKHDGTWRMCVDFKDLNNACPKDCYPLPEIDWKVESLCGYSFKCFLDAYKGYHQIKMAKEDEEKTAFITSQGIFCYSKMPFGLKNAGSTYQRLVDKAFQRQIGRNLEVYVDDTGIKARTEIRNHPRHNRNISKPFGSINKKLNPNKCTFGNAEESEVEVRVRRSRHPVQNTRTAIKGQLVADFIVERQKTIAGRTYDETRVEEEGNTWMTPICEYLTKEILPGDTKKARAVRRKAVRNPQQNLTPITSPWPFYKWGIDIAGPFPEGPGKVKFLIVAIDYFTKWIEAKAVATITGNQVKKFVWDNIVCRFGLPGEIISDNGKQFRDNPFKDWCEKLLLWPPMHSPL